MKKLLFFVLLLPQLVLANQKEQALVVGEYVYYKGDSIIVKQEAVITKDGFEFMSSKELDEERDKKE